MTISVKRTNELDLFKGCHGCGEARIRITSEGLCGVCGWKYPKGPLYTTHGYGIGWYDDYEDEAHYEAYRETVRALKSNFNIRSLRRILKEGEETIELDLDNGDTYLNQAELFKEKGELDQAYLNLAMAHQSKGDVDPAIADYSKAIELNPEYTRAYFYRAIAYQNKDDVDRAIADYSKAIELNPDDASSYYNRAIAYESKDEFDLVIADCSKVSELEPDVPGPEASYTYLSRAQACKDKVIALLRTTIKRLS